MPGAIEVEQMDAEGRLEFPLVVTGDKLPADQPGFP